MANFVFKKLEVLATLRTTQHNDGGDVADFKNKTDEMQKINSSELKSKLCPKCCAKFAEINFQPFLWGI